MKKVLVLATAVALLATPAFAAITGTKHDLSNGTTAGQARSNTNEICVFCHTPHGANAAGPLWNKTVGLTATAAYGDPSGTINATLTTAGIENSDAPLCLSCHDGSALGTLTNPPNSLTAALAITDGGNVTGGAIAGSPLLDADFSDDHPVGFVYADNSDPEVYDTATINTNLGGQSFFGAGSDEMWCSSCHDVHGVTGVDTFLRISNSGSGLCLACHNK